MLSFAGRPAASTLYSQACLQASTRLEHKKMLHTESGRRATRRQYLNVKQALLLILLVLQTSTSNAMRDMQLWSTAVATGQESSSQLLYWFELQERIGDDVRQFSQSFIRPALGMAVNDRNSLWVGYAYIYTDFPITTLNPFSENRLWQQWLYGREFKPFRLTNRLRLEERFFQNDPVTDWRIRNLVKLSTPLGRIPHTDFIVSEEIFFNINPVFFEEGAPPFDQNRFFIGVGYQASNELRIEAGYLYQFIERLGPSDFVGNVAGVTFIYQPR